MILVLEVTRKFGGSAKRDMNGWLLLPTGHLKAVDANFVLGGKNNFITTPLASSRNGDIG